MTFRTEKFSETCQANLNQKLTLLEYQTQYVYTVHFIDRKKQKFYTEKKFHKSRNREMRKKIGNIGGVKLEFDDILCPRE